MPDERQQWGCAGKHGYDSPGLADEVAARMRGAVTVYRCRFCRKWHLAHKNRPRGGAK